MPPKLPKKTKARGKYSTKGIFQKEVFEKLNLPKEVSEVLAETANLAIAEKTKSTYNTALKNVQKCEEELNEKLDLPWDNRETLCFVGWCIKKDLKASTIRSYLSGIGKLHFAMGYGQLDMSPPLLKEILNGHENKHLQKPKKSKNKRLPVTVNVLRLLKAELRNTNFSDHEKVVYWTICTTSFYGALRGSEVLSKYENFFDPTLTLCKKDVTICKSDEGKECVQLSIKNSKTNKTGTPELITIYSNDSGTCPVRSVKKLMTLNKNVPQDYPFFAGEDGKPVTLKKFNAVLKKLTSLSIKGGTISSHSFRIGITSILARKGYSDQQLKLVGRWSSRAFAAYIRLKRSNREQMAQACSKVQ